MLTAFDLYVDIFEYEGAKNDALVDIRFSRNEVL
jgi:hypothetical protein